MEELTNPFEIEKHKQELTDNRLNKQEHNKDYAYVGNEIELCDDCGSPINSHDHCPRCDY